MLRLAVAAAVGLNVKGSLLVGTFAAELALSPKSSNVVSSSSKLPRPAKIASRTDVMGWGTVWNLRQGRR